MHIEMFLCACILGCVVVYTNLLFVYTPPLSLVDGRLSGGSGHRGPASLFLSSWTTSVSSSGSGILRGLCSGVLVDAYSSLPSCFPSLLQPIGTCPGSVAVCAGTCLQRDGVRWKCYVTRGNYGLCRLYHCQRCIPVDVPSLCGQRVERTVE